MTTEPMAPPRPDGLDPDEDGGPPLALPWTLVVEGASDDEGWSADLEHGATLPRVGDLVEYIAEDGRRRVYRVRDVVHTVQSSAAGRPSVRDEDSLPNTTVSGDHVAHVPTLLRSGLPRVVVAAEPEGS